MAKFVSVDDEEDIVGMFKMFVSRIPGSEFVGFTNPLDACEYLLKEKCDLIISDFRMPLLKGTELINEVRKGEANKDTKVIFISAAIDEAERYCEYSEGIYFTSKPILFKEFREFIDKMGIE